jgi:hypothetical protein
VLVQELRLLLRIERVGAQQLELAPEPLLIADGADKWLCHGVKI